MNNKSIKEKIQSIWMTLTNLKSMDVVQQIADSQKKVNAIIGKNEIQKINHSSLLKFIIYELIIFAGQNHKVDQDEKTLRISSKQLNLQERLVKSIGRIKQIKSLLNSIGKNKKETTSEITIDVYDFKSLTRKLNILEENLLQEGNINRMDTVNPVDTEGMELMIEQLESLLKKKEKRIKELNKELEKSANDKNELEQVIYQLETRNRSLEEENQQLTLELSKINSQYEKYKIQQKDQLFYGGIDMANSQLLTNKIETNVSESTLNQQNQEQFDWNCLLAPNSNKMLEKCPSPPVSKGMIEDPALKKRFSNLTSKDDQSLLDSFPLGKQLCLKNDDSSLDRLLLMQALIIEHTLENILN